MSHATSVRKGDSKWCSSTPRILPHLFRKFMGKIRVFKTALWKDSLTPLYRWTNPTWNLFVARHDFFVRKQLCYVETRNWEGMS
jgi:hypothetical protein